MSHRGRLLQALVGLAAAIGKLARVAKGAKGPLRRILVIALYILTGLLLVVAVHYLELLLG